MALSIHTNHRLLFAIPAVSYVILVILCVIWPAMIEDAYEAEIPKPYSDELVQRGFELYGSYNCVTCHTQQVRGDERMATEIEGIRTIPVLKADARFGRERASTREEYAHQSPVYMGTQRIGPDLTSVGRRLPDAQWHYWHLYNPQSVSPDSLMPPHRILITTEPPPNKEKFDFDKVEIIQGLGVPGGKLWATPDAKALVEYLISLNREAVDALVEVR
jgi:cytochrome c oxidase cbb3-type subunit 2